MGDDTPCTDSRRVVIVEVIDDRPELLRVIPIGILNVSVRSEARVDTFLCECNEDAELFGTLTGYSG